MSSVSSASGQNALVGLTSQEAKTRLSEYGRNDPTSTRRGALAFELLHLFLNPLVIILLVASVISAFLGQRIEAELIFVIVVFCIAIDFVQTYRSQRAIHRLQEHVSLTATALRDGRWQEIKRQEIVPGDIVRLSARRPGSRGWKAYRFAGPLRAAGRTYRRIDACREGSTSR